MAEKIKDSECKEWINYLNSTAKIREDITQNDLTEVSKLFLALKRLSEQKRLHSINVKCQYEFSKEYGMVMCVSLSMLAEHGIISSCEGDMLNTVSMIILNYLSKNIVTYGDVIHHE
ncbi:MAG TPA: hypothetical protein GXX37_01140 [Clostridiaceae bacterium]|nr:hypothetical protein [Clostridiaceae bacterium]